MEEKVKIAQAPIAMIIRGLTQGGVRRLLFAQLDEWRQGAPEDLPVLIHNEEIITQRYSDFPQRAAVGMGKGYFDLVWSLLEIRKLKPRVVLYSKNIIPITHILHSIKKTNIIYDLGYFERGLHAYPLKDTLYMTTFFRFSCRLSHRVFAISDFTREDAIKRLGLAPEKVLNISAGVEDKFFDNPGTEVYASLQEKWPLDKPYYLYAGSLSPRKNLHRLLESIVSVLEDKDRRLIITGLKAWGDTQVVTDAVAAYPDRIHILGFVEEKELHALYRNAFAYLFPSLYEGFGLPILEAQANECVVVTSNRGACAEASGGAAQLVDPESVASIKAGVLSLENDVDLYELRQKGLENARFHSWKHSWQLLYQGILEVAD